MSRIGDLISNQSQYLLNNSRQAFVTIALLVILPFTSWLAGALIGLIVLRKGEHEGAKALMVALATYIAFMYSAAPVSIVIYSAMIHFVPVYLSAYVLRCSSNWRFVSGILLIQALVVYLLINIYAPGVIVDQLTEIKAMASQYESISLMFDKLGESKQEITVFAHILFGIQIATAVFFTVMSLVLARFIQAKCFNPGGFNKEIMVFRSGKIALLILLFAMGLAYCGYNIGISFLPLILLYFLTSGLLLTYVILKNKKLKRAGFILSLTLVIKPIIIFPAYITFGLLDSLFNFRVYFLKTLRETV